MKIGVYIVHKLDSSLTLFHTTQFKLQSLCTLKYFLTHGHLKFGCNLTFTLQLVFGDLDFQLSCEKSFFPIFLKT
jgi:hypothetical protein